MDRVTYHDQTDMQNVLKLREVLRTLPEFCRDYFRAIDATTTTKTRISYAYDIRIFFQFLVQENPLFKGHKLTDLTIDVLDQVQALDIEEYKEYLKVYKDERDIFITNGETGVKRKISTLRSFYNYYFRLEMIKTNPPALIVFPKFMKRLLSAWMWMKLPCFWIISNMPGISFPVSEKLTMKKQKSGILH